MRTDQVDYVGTQPIYKQPVTYVDYVLPFTVYKVRTQFWTGEVNVNNIFLTYYPERLAVALTVWAQLRERFGRSFDDVCARFGRHETRAALIRQIEFERMF